METLSLEEQRALDAELLNGESLLWTGKPNPRIVFHASDLFYIPFSLLWGGFALFWEGSALGFYGNHGHGPEPLMVLWGIPFVLMGQYVIWGRFLYTAWKKGYVLYALTNERVMMVTRSSSATVKFLYLRSIQGIEKEIRSNGNGTLKFGPTSSSSSGRRGTPTPGSLYFNSPTPVFVDIDDASSVANLVTQAMKRVQDSTALSTGTAWGT